MRLWTVSMGLVALLTVGSAGVESEAAPQDSAVIEAILEDISVGWEQGSDDPFYTHFLDCERPAISRVVAKLAATRSG